MYLLLNLRNKTLQTLVNAHPIESSLNLVFIFPIQLCFG